MPLYIYCCRFADLGAKVVLWDVNKKGNEAVAEEIRMKNQQAYAYQCDLSKRDDIYHVAAQVSYMYSRLNVHASCNLNMHIVNQEIFSVKIFSWPPTSMEIKRTKYFLPLNINSVRSYGHMCACVVNV